MAGVFNRVGQSLRSCCSGLKSYVFTRRMGAMREGEPLQCEITCDLTDKRTFFAWQRNHMANERTFLAWCRTGIALIAFGFLLERFDILIREFRLVTADGEAFKTLHGTRFMGMGAFVLGAIIIILAGWRFFYIRRLVNMGETDFSALPDMFLMISVLVAVVATLIFFAFFF